MCTTGKFGIVVILLVALTVPSAGQDTATRAVQQFTVGIKVGKLTNKPLTFDQGGGVSGSFDHFTWGPQIELGLPHGLGVELDALHAHYAYGGVFFNRLHGIEGFVNAHVSYWDFPLLLKWRSAPHGLRYGLSPFMAGGESTRRTTATGLSPVVFDPNAGYNNPVPAAGVSNNWTRGLVASGGVQFNIGHFHIAPELRYTHWAKPAIEDANGLAANTNQVDLLLGLTFGSR